MKKYFLIILILLSIKVLKSQNFEFVEATKQSWTGGICCRTGTNYKISFQSSDTVKTIKVDTVWIGNKCFAENQRHTFSVSKSIQKGKAIYLIQISESTNSRNSDEIDIIEEKTQNPPKYEGEAFIIYHSKKRKLKSVEIKQFKELERLAYP